MSTESEGLKRAWDTTNARLERARTRWVNLEFKLTNELQAINARLRDLVLAGDEREKQ